MGIKQETDIIGNIYGRLTVESFSHKEKDKRAGYTYYYNCKCECGNCKKIRRHGLIHGGTLSCGCLHKEQLADRNKSNSKYGEEIKKELKGLYNSWSAMIGRCNNESQIGYARYGGRGIKVFEPWHDWFTFRDWAIDNGWEDGLTIEIEPTAIP